MEQYDLMCLLSIIRFTDKRGIFNKGKQQYVPVYN